MKLSEAAAQGIARVRLPIWAIKETYLKLDLLPGGMRGPFVHLYERGLQEQIGAPTPQSVVGWGSSDSGEYIEYTGPLDRDDPTPDTP